MRFRGTKALVQGQKLEIPLESKDWSVTHFFCRLLVPATLRMCLRRLVAEKVGLNRDERHDGQGNRLGKFGATSLIKKCTLKGLCVGNSG